LGSRAAAGAICFLIYEFQSGFEAAVVVVNDDHFVALPGVNGWLFLNALQV
jgi:hypothetical protein